MSWTSESMIAAPRLGHDLLQPGHIYRVHRHRISRAPRNTHAAAVATHFTLPRQGADTQSERATCRAARASTCGRHQVPASVTREEARCRKPIRHARWRPAWHDGEIEPRPHELIELGQDHPRAARIENGRVANRSWNLHCFNFPQRCRVCNRQDKDTRCVRTGPIDRHINRRGTLFVTILNASRGVIRPQIALAYNKARQRCGQAHGSNGHSLLASAAAANSFR